MNITQLAKKYKLGRDDFWMLERGGRKIWIITHDACEKIQSIENITLDDIQVLNSDKEFVRLLIKMSKGKIKTMSIGEAELMKIEKRVTYNKYKKQYMEDYVKIGNCESNYVGSMAEKRGKDRCILKLINAYEYGIYSDAESDNFKRNNAENFVKANNRNYFIGKGKNDKKVEEARKKLDYLAQKEKPKKEFNF